jgi:ferric enterobactin receptor
MKLNRIIQLLCTNRKNKHIFALFLLALLFASSVFGQTTGSFHFQDVPLSDALLSVSRRFGANIAFDAKKLGQEKVSLTVEGKNIDDVLKKLLAKTDYNFLLKHGTYLIIPGKQNTKYERPAYANQLTGVIVDYHTNENLPYAYVMAVNENISQPTSMNGSFSLKNLNNPVRLKISYLGYQTLDTLLYLSDTLKGKTFKLLHKAQMIETVNIKAQKLEMISSGVSAGHTSINPASFVNLPNNGETDVFRTLQLMPGISFSESSADLNIRGGTADQNLVLLDGFTLYNLDHFFGTFSSINPNFVKDIQVYKGGFEARYGERVSGIIDITGKNGNQLRPTVYGGLNLLSGNLGVELPIGKKITLIAVARQNYNDYYSSFLSNNIYAQRFGKGKAAPQSSTTEITPEYRFSDFNTKLTYSISDLEKISFSAYGGTDRVDNSNSIADKRFSASTTDVSRWKNYGASGVWVKQWKDGYFSNFQLSASGYTNDYYNLTKISRDPKLTDPDQYLPADENIFSTKEENTLNDISVFFKNSVQLNANNRIELGILSRYNYLNYTKASDTQYIYNDFKQSSWLNTLYVHEEFTPGMSLTIRPGMRLSYYGRTRKTYAEPRLAANLKMGNHLLWKMSAGRYAQFVSKISNEDQYGYNRDFWVLADEQFHPVLMSNHFIAGANYTNKAFSFDFEFYYKNVSGLEIYQSVSPYVKNVDFKKYFPKEPGISDLPPSAFINGKGVVKGMDILAKYEGKAFTSWISYTLSKSTQKFLLINNGNEIPAPNDQRHKFNFVNMASCKKWNFSFVYTYASGLSYFTGSQPAPNMPTIRTYSSLPDFHRVDISANYDLRLGKVVLKIGGSVINLLNRTNYNQIYQRNFDFESTKFGEAVLIRSQTITPNLFINFRF